MCSISFGFNIRNYTVAHTSTRQTVVSFIFQFVGFSYLFNLHSQRLVWVNENLLHCIYPLHTAASSVLHLMLVCCVCVWRRVMEFGFQAKILFHFWLTLLLYHFMVHFYIASVARCTDVQYTYAHTTQCTPVNVCVFDISFARYFLWVFESVYTVHYIYGRNWCATNVKSSGVDLFLLLH